MDSFRISNEQSPVELISLAWSSSGLGDRKRCCLAVLTSNHLLSIWGPGHDPRQAAGWRRLLVVNNHFKKGNSDIEAFSWLPTLDMRLLNSKDWRDHPAIGPKNHKYYLAAISKDRNIHVFEICRSENDTMNAADRCKESLDTLQIPLSTRAAGSSNLKEAVKRAQDLSWMMNTAEWSEWAKIQVKSQQRSISTRSRVLGVSLVYSDSSGHMELKKVENGAGLARELERIQPGAWLGPGIEAMHLFVEHADQ